MHRYAVWHTVWPVMTFSEFLDDYREHGGTLDHIVEATIISLRTLHRARAGERVSKRTARTLSAFTKGRVTAAALEFGSVRSRRRAPRAA